MWSLQLSTSRIFGGVSRAVRCIVLISCALSLSHWTWAADLKVDPVRIELSPNATTAVVTITNNTDQEVSLQIQAMTWTQMDGKDAYVATRELLVAPPIITIAPKAEQLIRLALRRNADETRELTYRIYLQELLGPPVTGFSGMQVALRIGLPVFVQPMKGLAVASKLWRLERSGDKQLKLTLKNDGNAHIQVTDFTLQLPNEAQPIVGEAGSTYVLAGQSHEWRLNTKATLPIAVEFLQLKAYTDDGYIESDLPFAAQ
jgi:fimbrial chaperone protein